jgi:DNA polymerase III epsilon subunit-like protein
MIFFDVETTGLIDNEGLPLSQQPEIIEIGALRIDGPATMANDGLLVVLDTFSTFVKPTKLPLPPIITKITGIRDEDLTEAPLFIEVYGALARFFTGSPEMLAHNARFDLMMLVFELRRCAKEYQFPYCPRLTDTKAFWPGKLEAWGRKVKGDSFVQTHRALDDARLLAECYFAEVGI